MNVVWVVTRYPTSPDDYAGSFHRTQAQALARLGCSITVIAPTPWVPPHLDRVSNKWAEYRSAPRNQMDGAVQVLRPRYVAIPHAPRWARPEAAMAGAVIRALRRGPRPDVVHGHFVMPIGEVSRLVARKRQIPYVVSAHGTDMMSRDPAKESDERYRQVLTSAASVIAISDGLAPEIGRFGISALTIPVGVDITAISSMIVDRDAARHELGVSRTRRLVLFVGNLIPTKGVRELVAAMASLDHDAELVLAGRGPLAGFGARPSRVTYAGALTKRDVVRWMCAADVLVLPSTYEGLGTVLIEAGLAKLPVIGTDTGGIASLLGDDRGTLIASNRSRDIADAIDAVIGNHAVAEDKAARLDRFVRQHFDVMETSGRLLSLYSSVVEAYPTGVRVG